MNHKARKISHAKIALLLGLLGTAFVVLLELSGLLQETEYQTLDWRFRRYSKAETYDGLVHVDIDDKSLEKIGRWPWPRQQLAALIDQLTQCDAQAIALDVILPDPQQPRFISDDTKADDNSTPVEIFDDLILADAIKRSSVVYMAAYLEDDTEGPSLPRTRLRELLSSDLSLSLETLTARTQLPREQIRSLLYIVQEEVARARISRLLAEKPGLSLQQVQQELIPSSTPITRELQDILRKVYLRHRSQKELQRFTIELSGQSPRKDLQAQLVGPLVIFARHARRAGLVNISYDSDNVVRRISLFEQADGKWYPQFALSLAQRHLRGGEDSPLRVVRSDGDVHLLLPDGHVHHIPLDRNGKMLINWAPDTLDKSNHIPASAVLQVWQEHNILRQIDRKIHLLQKDILSLGMAIPKTPGFEEKYFACVDLLNRHQEAVARIAPLQRHMLQSSLYAPAQTPPGKELAAAKEAEERLQRELIQTVAQLTETLRKAETLDAFLAKPSPDATDEQKAQYLKARQHVEQRFAQIDSLGKTRPTVEQNAERLQNELRSRIAGKTCLIGSTATGAQDFFPTPLSSETKPTPGIEVHANIFNTILTGQAITQPPLWLDILVIVVAGVVVSWVTARYTITIAGPVVFVLSAAYAIINASLLFGQFRIWLAMVTPLAAVLCSFLLVTAYRQLVEERAKRKIRTMFSHALSEELVDRLLADPSIAQLGGHQRTISCLFSDLAGFTSISQQLGPRKTVRLLNSYFDHATEIIQTQCNGYLNKFLGDGIFAFFGAPVQQPDHPRRSIAAAVACQTMVKQMNHELADLLGEDIRLEVRVGITTGQAMVGNCGSTQRMDYTAIGDCVNLASRLEAANKFFRTNILVDESTWHETQDKEFLARPLGPASIVGVAEPVHIWEVCGYRKNESEEVCRAYDLFANGMEQFQKQQYDLAQETFEEVLQILGEDFPAEIFCTLARQCHMHVPNRDFYPSCPTGNRTVSIVLPWERI